METTVTSQTWQDMLAGEKQKPYFQAILQFLQTQQQQGKTIYPAQSNIFNALKFTPYSDVKVVILGQDPYHGPKQAHGLSFSVQPGIQLPPSLQNIFLELKNDLKIPPSTHGCLEKWAKQGVLLLNAVLTVEANKPQSHANIGWQEFTDKIILTLNEHADNIVYLLWGSYAQKKVELINTKKHQILMSSHPSPLSSYRGFIGCKHFSKTNEILRQWGRPQIDWQLDK